MHHVSLHVLVLGFRAATVCTCAGSYATAGIKQEPTHAHPHHTCVEVASLRGLFPKLSSGLVSNDRATTPSLCDVKQYISPESIADGTYIKPVAVVLCLGNLVSALVPIRSYIAKTMYKPNNNPPNST